MGLKEEDLQGKLEMLIGEEMLIITKATQLNLLGQVFRPVFSGTVSDVQPGHITLTPVIIKMVNAPFYRFPFPLSIPLEQIVSYSTDVPSDMAFPLT
ncbi:hypothetical protein M3193_07720 [Sporosarcina luteola]|uniref:hypothetical protein n=1 Tax=Sporosarcina luteola TaxID=582850 RepID=UPI00203B57C5|nr:hypothetical protein [Sporosarcina luteola]MCM3744030.1 hypothetical protein [Sporosarcina luteola]